MRTAILCAVIVLSASGCKMGVPSNPNEPQPHAPISGDILRRNLQWAYEELDRRESSHQITEVQKTALMKKYAKDALSIDAVANIPPQDAWKYGDVYRTAERWPQAKIAYELAVKVATDEDRRINDNLRLAFVLAKLGDIQGAIEHARSTFNAKRTGKAPILLATLYEIVPAAQGHGKDFELAELLTDAIAQHELTIVDLTTGPGKMFYIALPHHLKTAWQKVAELYRNSGKGDLAEGADRRAESLFQRPR